MEWIAVKEIRCEQIGQTASLLERRQYLDTRDAQGRPDYFVQARRCSHDLECNMDDHVHCQWAFKLGYDPFEGVSEVARLAG